MQRRTRGCCQARSYWQQQGEAAQGTPCWQQQLHRHSKEFVCTQAASSRQSCSTLPNSQRRAECAREVKNSLESTEQKCHDLKQLAQCDAGHPANSADCLKAQHILEMLMVCSKAPVTDM